MKAAPLPRPNWSCPLPQPLVIPKVMTLTTFADARALIRHLPEDRRLRSMWQLVAADIKAAAADGDIEGAAIGLRPLRRPLGRGIGSVSLGLGATLMCRNTCRRPKNISTKHKNADALPN